METEEFIDKIYDENSVFEFRGKRYKWKSAFMVPSIEMECIDDGSTFAFGINAPIRDEFILANISY